MAGNSVRAWTRPHDWAEVVLGAAMMLSPLVFETSTAALWTTIVLGALIAVDGLVSLSRPGLVYGEWVQIGFGVLLFISPWVMGYTEMTAAAWMSWLVGVLTVIVGMVALPVAIAAHNRTAGQH
ncbi:SPW repeat-containing protein [Haloechinothrix alba]|uniref:SPW repeat-containing protein n=1 Tax=Haloechinothrix alba TaxID=664784 RepID=A0A238VKN9_9PSEU|nr:SPW repeat protein [Haloechinothrix alba]SNR34734.1 SPW repeat-containing protein [Haloechinothrix alba]